MTSDTPIAAPDSTLSEVVVALTTLPADFDAEAFGETLVREKVAACVSVGAPMMSLYTWKGAVERAAERQLVVKTVREKIPLLKSRLAALHPYDVPELIVLPAVEGGEAYLAWVRESTAG